MTNQDIVRGFSLSLDKLSSSSLPEISLSQKLYYINKAILEIVIDKFTPYNKIGKGFDENSLRQSELRKLIVKVDLTSGASTLYTTGINLSLFVIPTAQLFYIRYDKSIKALIPGCSTPTYTPITKIGATFVELDDIDKLLSDPFNKPEGYETLDNVVAGNIEIYSDSTSIISNVNLTYLKTPTVITDQSTTTYTDLSDIVLYNAIDKAVQEVLEVVESDRTNSHQIQLQETI